MNRLKLHELRTFQYLLEEELKQLNRFSQEELRNLRCIKSYSKQQVSDLLAVVNKIIHHQRLKDSLSRIEKENKIDERRKKLCMFSSSA